MTEPSDQTPPAPKLTEAAEATGDGDISAPALNELSVTKLGHSLQDYFNSALTEKLPDDLLALVDSLGQDDDDTVGGTGDGH